MTTKEFGVFVSAVSSEFAGARVRRLVLAEPWDTPATSGVKLTANLTRNRPRGNDVG